MTYPDYNTYSKLYGRYLKKGPEPFFAKMAPCDKRILDLCAGGGQLSTYALAHGASSIVQVDLAPQMLDPQFQGGGHVTRIKTDVQGYLHCFNSEPLYDMVVCRQGTNYWFKHVSGEEIARVIKKGGMLVFNTFGNKPTEEPMVKEYYHGGKKYREVSFLFEGRVHHVQTAEGMEPHFTVFDWISHDEYTQKLAPYFITEEILDGPSSMWYCWRV